MLNSMKFSETPCNLIIVPIRFILSVCQATLSFCDDRVLYDRLAFDLFVDCNRFTTKKYSPDAF